MTVGPLRRWALLLVASALAAGPLAVLQAASAGADTLPACSSNAGCVHITYPDDKTRPAVDVPASVLESDDDITTEPYNVCYPTGCETEPVTGVSLHHLLTSVVPEADQINTSSVTYAELTVPGTAYESTLRTGELNDPSPFVEDLEPVFAPSGADPDIEYVRPQRDAQDLNGRDRYLTGSTVTTIDLAVYTSGAVVHPTITVSGTRHVNDPLTFSASFAADDPPHAGATFAWTFAEGDPSEPGDQTTMHTYLYNDTYRVSVAVTGTDPDVGPFSGVSPPVTVQIGPTTPPGKGPPGGGNGKGGTKHPTSGPTKAPGHHQGSSPTGGPTAAPTSVAPKDTSEPTGPAGPTSSPTSDPTSATPTSGTSDPTPPTTTPGPRSADGAFVQGVLIEGPLAPAGGTPPTAATRAAASARQPGRPGASFDPRWLWLLVPIALLAAGAFGERRRGPHRHGPQSSL